MTWSRRAAACLAALLLGLALLGPAQAAEPAYRFRGPAAATPVPPAHDLLDADERRFLAGLPEVRVGLNLPDNRPYEVVGEDGTISGIQIELLTHLALALGLRLKPVVLPSFPEALQALRDGRIDMMATLGYDPAREAFVAFTLGTAPNPGAVIARAGGPPWQAQTTLDGRGVAIERGYVAQHHVRRTWPEARLIEQPDTSAALRAVAQGEADAYVGSLLMAMDRIQRDATAGLEVKKTLVYGTGQMHFGVRRDWPLLASALNKGIAALRAAPLPSLRAALQTLASQGSGDLPLPLALSAEEQRLLARRAVLRVGAVRGLELLNEATAGGGHAGIASDYTTQVMARLGVAAAIVPFDSVGAMLDALRAGEIDIVPFLTYTGGRARDFRYSEPYLEMPYYIVARSDAPLYWDLDSLRGKRLALAAQHPLREVLDELYPDIQVVEARSGTGAMDLVASGQADAAVEVKLFANIRINGDNNGLLRTVAQVEALPAQFHFAAGRHVAGLVPLINRALADIGPEERGRMLRRWIAIDFAPGIPWRRHLPWLAAAGTGALLLAGASVWWMRRLAREVRSRRAAEEQLADMAASLPGVVFQYTVGPDGRLQQRYLSPSVEGFLGPGAVQQAGLLDAVMRHMAPADTAVLREAGRQSLAERAPFKQTLHYQDPRLGGRWLHVEAAAHCRADGSDVWTGYLVDVSTERALQSRLLDAVETKNLFVATASHELRGPLQVITLALQQLGRMPLPEPQRQLCRVAQDSSANLVQLIDDVLDLARLEAGRMTLHPGPVDLPVLLGQLVENHRLVAEARGLRLSLLVEPALRGPLLLDGLRLRQLLVNLLGNALKYTVQGEVSLAARVLAAPDDGAVTSSPGDGAAASRSGDGATASPPGPLPRLLLVVRDTGPGIAPERQQALFEPFATAHTPGPPASPAQEAPGAPAQAAAPAGERSTGLGLAICRRLVEAMDGRISLQSVPGQGTVVTVDLPMPPPAPMAAAAPPPVPAAAAVEGTVLLVDDDAVTRLLMGEALRRAGFSVVEAAGAELALARWRAGGVVLVISDHQMPGGDGLALLRQIADGSPPGQRPRLVLCSGSLLEAAADAAFLDAQLRKPVTADALARTARQVLGLPLPA